LHIYRKAFASEGLIGDKFTEEQPLRLMTVLNKAKERLIKVRMVSEPYAPVGEGIIDGCRKNHDDLVIIGRKKMSKAEEFVMGDVRVKLVRALERSAVLVIKSG